MKKRNRSKQGGARGLPGRLPGIQKVRAYLHLLYPPGTYSEKESEFYQKKIKMLLLILAGGVCLILAGSGLSGQYGAVSENGEILRDDYGGSGKEVILEGYALGEKRESEEDIGSFQITVGARQYTGEETAEMARRLEKELPEIIRGENASLSSVSTDLKLLRSAEGYPFTITWDSDAYSIVNASGEVDTEALEGEVSAEVTLTARLEYADFAYEIPIEVSVVKTEQTPRERLRESVYRELLSAEEDRTQSRYVLPGQIEGVSVRWEEKKEDMTGFLGALLLAVLVLYYWAADRDLGQKVKEREEQLEADYPKIVSKFVLYLGAGMSVRNIFRRLAAEYIDRDGEKKESRRYVYEEIALVCNELDSGCPETEAYRKFGDRCRSVRYSRFSSLLSQNLRKGNTALLEALQEEAEDAFRKRQDEARKKGEEAGTKQVFPMIMMLAVVMAVIMIPAYRSFGF